MRDDNTEPRDNQQMQDDNQQAGQSVRAGQTSGESQHIESELCHVTEK